MGEMWGALRGGRTLADYVADALVGDTERCREVTQGPTRRPFGHDLSAEGGGKFRPGPGIPADPALVAWCEDDAIDDDWAICAPIGVNLRGRSSSLPLLRYFGVWLTGQRFEEWRQLWPGLYRHGRSVFNHHISEELPCDLIPLL